jgi:hypothetical protein
VNPGFETGPIRGVPVSGVPGTGIVVPLEFQLTTGHATGAPKQFPETSSKTKPLGQADIAGDGGGVAVAAACWQEPSACGV